MFQQFHQLFKIHNFTITILTVKISIKSIYFLTHHNDMKNIAVTAHSITGFLRDAVREKVKPFSI